jgi:hypothetical protein
MQGIIFLIVAFVVLNGITKLLKQAGDQKPGPTVSPEQPPAGREQQLPLRSEMPQQPQQQQWQGQQPPQPVPRQQVPLRSRVPQQPQPVPQQQVPPRTVVVQQQRQAPAAAAPYSRSRTAVEQRVWQALPPEVRGYLERVAAQQQGVQQPMRTAPLPTPAASPRAVATAATAARPPAVRQQVRRPEGARERPREVLPGMPFEDMNDVRRAIVVSEILRRPRVFRMYPQR